MGVSVRRAPPVVLIVVVGAASSVGDTEIATVGHGMTDGHGLRRRRLVVVRQHALCELTTRHGTMQLDWNDWRSLMNLSSATW